MFFHASSSTSKRPTRASQVDDDFFNLREFNEWTERQEQRDMLSEDEREDDEDEDEDIDLNDDPDAIEDQDLDDINANGEAYRLLFFVFSFSSFLKSDQ